jgi:hypothetical protein
MEREWCIVTLAHTTVPLSSSVAVINVHLVLYSEIDGKWKISDFGISSEGTSSYLVTTTSSRGKPSYRAPELLEFGNGKYSHKSDIWAVGCVLFEMITRRKRFNHDYAVIKHAESPMRSPLWNGGPIGDTLSFFLVPDLLEIDPAQRPSTPRLRALVGLIPSIISHENYQDSVPSDFHLAAMEVAISLNQQDSIDLLLREVLIRPAAVSTASFALSLEVADKGITDLLVTDFLVQSSTSNTIWGAARHASSRGYAKAISVMMNEMGLNPNTVFPDENGFTLMDLAVSHNHPQVVALLYDVRCPLNQPLASQLQGIMETTGIDWAQSDARYIFDQFSDSLTPFKFFNHNREQPSWTAIVPHDTTGELNLALLYQFDIEAMDWAFPSFVNLSRDGSYLAASHSQRSIELFDLSSGNRFILETRGLFDTIPFEFSPDSKHLIVTRRVLASLFAYSVESRELRELFQLPNQQIKDFDLSPNGKEIALVLVDSNLKNVVEIREFPDGRLLRTFSSEFSTFEARAAAFSLDGRMLAITTSHGTTVWHPESNRTTARGPTDLAFYSRAIFTGEHELWLQSWRSIRKVAVDQSSSELRLQANFEIQINDFKDGAVGRQYLGVVRKKNTDKIVSMVTFYDLESGKPDFDLTCGHSVPYHTGWSVSSTTPTGH